jgi:anionic cell wall polymer biosynthesis LytR-Cps2A-Psr (LCP) family protein
MICLIKGTNKPPPRRQHFHTKGGEGLRAVRYRYFFLSFAVAFVLLSLLFYALVRIARPGSARGPERQLAAAETTTYVPSEADALTVLFAGEDGGVFLLARFDPAGGGVPIVALPRETAVRNNDRSESLAEVYRYGGIDYTRARLAETLGITIDRYVRMDASAFVSAADAVGAVEFVLPEPLTVAQEGGIPLTLSAGTQLLDGTGAAHVIGYAGGGDERARCALIAELTAAIVNQRMDVVLSDVMDNVFTAIVNLVDTDISYADYDDRKRAAAFLARLGQEPARTLTAEGDYSESGELFTLSDTFVARVILEFS